MYSHSGGVPELADGHDLGSCVERRRGSSPRFPTTHHPKYPLNLNHQGILSLGLPKESAAIRIQGYIYLYSIIIYLNI